MASKKPETKLVKKIIKALEKQFSPSLWTKIHGGPYQVTGISDIIGCYKKEFYALEVKVPGKEHTVTARQQLFIDLINLAGGHGTMITSVDQGISFVTRNQRKKRRLIVGASVGKRDIYLT